jgi:hypothetical protein
MNQLTQTNPRSGNRISVQPSRLGIVLAGLLLCLAKPASAGVVTITMIDNGSSISVSMSGSLDFTSAGAGATTPSFGQTASTMSNSFPNYIAPVNGTIGFGPSGTPTQQWNMLNSTYPLNVTSTSPVQSQPSIFFSPFGSGPYAANAITNVSGSNFFVYTGAIAVAPGYTSGGALSATGTIAGSFASNGITVGTSTTQFTLGAGGGSGNTLIFQRSVASASVPDQMPTAALGAGVVLMGLAARRRRR